jgi:hypothetical protein
LTIENGEEEARILCEETRILNLNAKEIPNKENESN